MKMLPQMMRTRTARPKCNYVDRCGIMPHPEFVKGKNMNLSEIIAHMQIRVVQEVDKGQADLGHDIADILRRKEQIPAPLPTAYWLTTRDSGTFFAFSDNVNETALTNFCGEFEKYIRGNGHATCRRINFETGELTVIPVDKFLKTVKQLEAVTGANETKISADNDPNLYLNSAAYAYRHNEIETFRNSNRQNMYCADSLYYVVDKDFDGSAAHDHLTSFSLERTIFVAAAAVLNAESQSAFDNKAVEWAKEMLKDIPQGTVETAPAINVKPEALSEFILNKLIPTVEAEAANSAEDTEGEDMDGADRF